MNVFYLTLLVSFAFADLREENAGLKRTNEALTKLLKQFKARSSQIARERSVAFVEGQFCLTNDDCPGGVCSFGECKDLFLEGAACVINEDCPGGMCSFDKCTDLYLAGAACVNPTDCASGYCSWNRCREAVDCDIRTCQVCADTDYKCVWMNGDCYDLEEVLDRWSDRDDTDDVFAVHTKECPDGIDSISDANWCEFRMRAGPYPGDGSQREYVVCESNDVKTCPHLCAEIAAMGVENVRTL